MTQREQIEALRTEVAELRKQVSAMAVAMVELAVQRPYAPAPIQVVPQPWNPQPWNPWPTITCSSTTNLGNRSSLASDVGWAVSTGGLPS